MTAANNHNKTKTTEQHDTSSYVSVAVEEGQAMTPPLSVRRPPTSTTSCCHYNYRGLLMHGITLLVGYLVRGGVDYWYYSNGIHAVVSLSMLVVPSRVDVSCTTTTTTANCAEPTTTTTTSTNTNTNTTTTTPITNPAVVSYAFLDTSKGQALVAQLQELVKTTTPLTALQQLETHMTEDGQVLSSCHPVIHTVGRTAYEMYGLEGAVAGLLEGAATAQYLRLCNAGYLHGVVERHLVLVGSDKNDNTTMSVQDQLLAEIAHIRTLICQPFAATGIHLAEWECLHGIGHGIFQHYRHANEHATIVQSLDICEQFSNSPGLAVECQNGMWMEHFASTRMLAHISPHESLAWCQLSPHSKGDCALYAPTEFLLHRPRQYEAALEFCQQGTSKNDSDDDKTNLFLRRSCIQGVGSQTQKENMNHATVVTKTCRSLDQNKDQKACFDAARSYVKMSTGDFGGGT